jgi:hypothetical protein
MASDIIKSLIKILPAELIKPTYRMGASTIPAIGGANLCNCEQNSVGISVNDTFYRRKRMLM